MMTAVELASTASSSWVSSVECRAVSKAEIEQGKSFEVSTCFSSCAIVVAAAVFVVVRSFGVGESGESGGGLLKEL